MPEPRFKSRTFRRVFVKTPGGKTVMQYKKRKPAKAQCAACGKNLPGVPRERPVKMMKLGKTEKRPERPFGGVLCSACAREKFREKARALQ